MLASVDRQHGAGQVAGGIADQEGGGGADIVDIGQLMLRRAGGGVVEQGVEVIDAGGGAGADR